MVIFNIKVDIAIFIINLNQSRLSVLLIFLIDSYSVTITFSLLNDTCSESSLPEIIAVII